MKRKKKPTGQMRILDTHSRAKEAFDEPGRVRIYMRLVDNRGRLVKGNVARSITVEGVTVTKVFQIVRGALENA